MTLLGRRILYLSFFLLFLIAAPLVLFYSLGYDYNPKKKAVVYHGGLYLKFSPKDATVTINENIYQEKTPLNLTNLLPGVYTLTVQKDGYHPWQKQIRILPRQTNTLLIHLFPSQLPIKVPAPVSTPTLPQQTSVTHFSLTPTRNSMLVTSKSSGATTTVPFPRASYFEYENVPLLFVYQQQTKQLTLILDGPQKLKTEKFKNILGIEKISDVVVFWSDFEIWVIDSLTAHRELITRVSEEIRKVLLYEKQYLIYATAPGNISAIEIDARFGRTTTLLASFSSVESIQLLKDSLLVSGSYAKEKGWYQINLK